MAGLQRFEPLLRVLAVFAALGFAEAAVARVAARYFHGPPGQDEHASHDP